MGRKNLSDDDTPEKPDADAGIPQEDAHLQRLDAKPVKEVVNMEKENTLDETLDSGRVSPLSDCDGDFLITEAMLREEEELTKRGRKKEKKLEAESKENFDEQLMEQRYKRLQHLLKKSSIYANFLLLKMEQQKLQEQKKLERVNKSKKSEERSNSQGEEAKSQSSEEDEIPDSQATSPGSQSGRHRLRTQRKVSPKAEDKIPDNQATSPSSQEGRHSRRTQRKVSPKAETTKPTKTMKRKRATESYAIGDYVDKEALKAKKLKPDSPGRAPPPEGNTTHGENKSIAPSEDVTEETDSFSRIIDGQRVSDKQPMSFSGGVLRPYQVEGFEWLQVLYENGVNGILADEMGLGKTIQVIALFSHIIEMGVPGPFLVCAPLSTLPNWMSEFSRFSPDIPTILYHGQISERAELRREIKKHLGKYKVQPVVITSYEIVMRDRKYLEHYLWKYVVVDEGHRIKNLNCRLIRELKMYKTANRLLLTGTPLQNNLSELWSMLNFLLPEVFDDLRTFESWFNFTSLSKEGGDEEIVKEEREKHVLSMLHQILSPFLLRRLKTDVELSIPKKKEIIVHAPLTALQEEYYRNTVNKTILDKLKQKEEGNVEEIPLELTSAGKPKRRTRANMDYSKFLNDTDEDSEEDVLAWAKTFTCDGLKSAIKPSKVKVKKSEVNIRLLNVVMQLRKCCNHPYLMSYPLDPVTQEYRVDEELITSSGKFLVLERLLPALKKNNHKVLIFSQMTSLLDLLQDFCIFRKHNYCRLDGKMIFQERQEQMTKFRTDPDSFLFLLSTRAGGLGINLTTADTVIIFDSDWNPQSDLQAMDRCHRIGQEKPVVVYRLVTAGTIDQKMVERAAAKRKLEKMVIHQGKFKGGANKLNHDKSVIDPKDLLELLRSHDYSNVVNHCSAKVISDADLEILLDRSDLVHQGSSKKEKTRIPIKSKVFEIVEADEGSNGILG